jgi:hypothetical protein
MLLDHVFHTFLLWIGWPIQIGGLQTMIIFLSGKQEYHFGAYSFINIAKVVAVNKTIFE